MGQQQEVGEQDIHDPWWVKKCRVQWKSWAIYSRDGEYDELYIDGKNVWKLQGRGQRRRRQICAYQGRSEEGTRTNGCSYWNGRENCLYNGDVTVPCSDKMKL